MLSQLLRAGVNGIALTGGAALFVFVLAYVARVAVGLAGHLVP